LLRPPTKQLIKMSKGMRIILLSLIFSMLLIRASFGQALLTPEDAVNIAVKNNYDILISQTASEISRTDNTAGNAGLLPAIGLNITDNYAHNNTSLDLSSGEKINSSNAHSNALNGNVELNWTLFDGGKMFVTKKKLNEIEALGEIQFKDQVNQTVYEVTMAYFDVVRQKQQLSSINEAIDFNQERVKILEASFNAGLVPKTDLLQSQVDLNVYLENAILQETVIVNSKRTLNKYLSQDPDRQFEVIDSIVLNYVADSNELMGKLYNTNTQVLSYQKQLEVSKLSVKELVAQRYPSLNFNASYNYLRSDNSASNVLKNRTYGPQLGGALTLPLYYGGNISRQINIARLEETTAGYNLQSIRLQVNMELLNALTAYKRALQLVNLEKDNSVLARENLTICMQRLRLGQTTSLEVRQAEESYVQSLTRKILFEYAAKDAETKLKQLIAAFCC
jgi:outer membrane protein